MDVFKVCLFAGMGIIGGKKTVITFGFDAMHKC